MAKNSQSLGVFVVSLVLGAVLFALYLMCFQYPRQVAGAFPGVKKQSFYWKGIAVQVLSCIAMGIVILNVALFGVVACRKPVQPRRKCECSCLDDAGQSVGETIHTESVDKCEAYCETVPGASQANVQADDGACPMVTRA